MKITHTLTLLFALCFFVSCHQRVELDGRLARGDRGEVIPITFNAGIANYDVQGLRAVNSSELQKNAGRLNIDGIRIVFYRQDQAGNPTEVAYAFHKKAKSFNGTISSSDGVHIDFDHMSIAITSRENIAIGDYTVLFFTTPSQSLITATEVGMRYAALATPLTYDYRVPNAGMSNLGFNLYTNAHKPLKVTAQALSSSMSTGTPYVISASDLVAVNASVYLDFPKSLSVNAVTYNPALSASLFFDTQNRKFVLFPKYVDALFDEPLAGKTSYKIPQDANYEGFATKSIEELQSDFIYLDKAWGTAYTFFSSDRKDQNYILPVAENTLASLEATGKVTTRIIVGIPMMPTGKTIAPNEYGARSFFVYDDEVLSYADLKGRYDAALSSSSRTPEQTRLIAEIQKMNAFAQTTGAQSSGASIVLPLRCGYDGLSLKYYFDGIMYYTIPPRHYSDANVRIKDKPGRFGIVRHTLYTYSISSLSRYGVANPLTLVEDRSSDLNAILPPSMNLSIGNPDVLHTDLIL